MNIVLTKGAYLVDGERSINLYPVFNASKKVHEFVGTGGLPLLASLGGQPIRGLYIASNDDSHMYAVAGNGFYKIAADYTYVRNATTLNSSSGLVEFSDNGLEITITDGADGYTYTLASGVLAKIADLDFPGAASNCFLSGYTVVIKPTSSYGYASDLYASTAWDALSFARAEGLPDDLVRCIEHNQKLWLFGTISTEVWIIDPTSPWPAFPFSP